MPLLQYLIELATLHRFEHSLQVHLHHNLGSQLSLAFNIVLPLQK
jgi:hypothetical protein